MGKKKQAGGLGKSLIKDRFGPNAHKQADSYLHTSELDDGLDWNRINLKSVTEENTLDEFLATAELAGTEFSAERLNVTVVDAVSPTGLLSVEEELAVKETQEKHKNFLTIPRRPEWDETTTAEELDQRERTSFLEWRRELAKLQDVEGIILTPFERNLDFWRQLWRVTERSDVVVQIVDARDPLLYRCEDLELYVKEVSETKLNVILINKADFLTDEQRKYWANYFDNAGMKVVFWSAVLENERQKEMERQSQSMADEGLDEDTSSVEMEESDEENITYEEEDYPVNTGSKHEEIGEKQTQEINNVTANPQGMDSDSVTDSKELLERKSHLAHGNTTGSKETDPQTENRVKNDSHIVNGEELVDFFKSCHTGHTYTEGVTTIGLVGYPNVGKSSTINAILQTKKVPVSATPGRTKHFQTLFLDETLMLCDCPGLVMPTFITTKAEMINSGILPIDQMRDYVPPVSLICKLIPRKLLESVYGILLPPPKEGEDPNRPPTAHELLGSFALMRGFMTHKGVPDFQRASRLILKDFVSGTKLLYCNPPPGVQKEDYKSTADMVKLSKKNKPTIGQNVSDSNQPGTQGAHKMIKVQKVVYQNEVDKDFFTKKEVRVGSKGVKGVLDYRRPEGFTGHHSSSDPNTTDRSQPVAKKPWKKHNNFRKKEKLRRLNKQLDVV